MTNSPVSKPIPPTKDSGERGPVDTLKLVAGPRIYSKPKASGGTKRDSGRRHYNSDDVSWWLSKD